MSQHRPLARNSHPSRANEAREGTPPAGRPPTAAGASPRRPAGLLLLRTVALLAGLVLMVSLFGRLHGLMIEDDAFIFARYANNLLHHGIFAWNPHGPPTYGTTSILYVGVVGLLRALAGAFPARVVVLSSLLCGIAFVALITLVVRRGGLPASARSRAALAVFLLVPAAWSADPLTAHFVTGMDTTFALSALTLVILAAVGFEQRPTGRRGAWLALATGLAFFARPDLVMFSLPLVAAIGLRPPSGVSRATVSWIAAGSLATTAAGCALAWSYFGVPLPLSFYVKGLVRYGGDLEASYASVPGEQLMLFARSTMWWAVPIVVRLVRDAGRKRWTWSSIESALLIGCAAFIVYYRFFVLQVMPHDQRFYYPTLPALIVLAARSAVELGREPWPIPRRGIVWGASRTPSAALARGAAAIVVTLPLWGPLHRGIERARAQPPFFGLRAMDNLRGFVPRNWFELEEFASLPDDVVIAATEIGVPGVVFPGKRIIDLSGLNDPGFARHGFDPEALFGPERPDLVYMPHPDYRLMTQRILDNPTFRGEYEFYPGRTLRTVLGIALRKTSTHYDAMREILYSGNTRRTRTR